MFEFYIKCDFLPLLLNNSKAIFRGRMIKTKKARDFERQLTAHLKNNYSHLKNYQFKTNELHLFFIVASPRFITAKGKRSKTSGDIDGRIKHTLDIIFKTLLPSLDDSQVVRLQMELAVAETDQFHLVLRDTHPMNRL